MSMLKKSGYKALAIAEDIGLLIIALATVFAVSVEALQIFKAMKVTLADLLLLFIYLEILAMVGIYLKTGKLPVRIPLYIAIVAIARYMIIDMKSLETIRVIGLGGTILILAISALAIRYGHTKYPYENTKESG